MDFDQTCIYIIHSWKSGKNWLDFGDLDIIFKVTILLGLYKSAISIIFRTGGSI